MEVGDTVEYTSRGYVIDTVAYQEYEVKIIDEEGHVVFHDVYLASVSN